jgi:hypothetical protein
MKATGTCPKCHSKSLWKIADVAANTDTGTMQQQPTFRLAVTGRGTCGHAGELEAYACRRCGFVEMYLTQELAVDGTHVRASEEGVAAPLAPTAGISKAGRLSMRAELEARGYRIRDIDASEASSLKRRWGPTPDGGGFVAEGIEGERRVTIASYRWNSETVHVVRIDAPGLGSARVRASRIRRISPDARCTSSRYTASSPSSSRW